MDRRSDNATSVDVEIDPHRRRLGRSQTYFALQAIVECRRKRNESQCCCVDMIYSVGKWAVTRVGNIGRYCLLFLDVALPGRDWAA